MRGQVDDICLRYFCERCGAAPRVWCSTDTGGRATFLHVSRFSQAVEHGELPLPND
jgi:hypothetical protein